MFYAKLMRWWLLDEASARVSPVMLQASVDRWTECQSVTENGFGLFLPWTLWGRLPLPARDFRCTCTAKKARIVDHGAASE